MFLTQYVFTRRRRPPISRPKDIITVNEVDDEQDYIIVTFGEGVYAPLPQATTVEVNDEQDYVITRFE